MSENLLGASRYFGTYENSVLIFNHNYLLMLGIESDERPKQELIEIFLFQAKLLVNQMKAITEPL